MLYLVSKTYFMNVLGYELVCFLYGWVVHLLSILLNYHPPPRALFPSDRAFHSVCEGKEALGTMMITCDNSDCDFGNSPDHGAEVNSYSVFYLSYWHFDWLIDWLIDLE